MYVYIDAPIILGLLYMYECMHVCMYYVSMYVLRSLFGALIGALGGIYVSQVEYACIINVGIHVYRRADSTRYMYVCMHHMYVLCMYVCMYVCMCSNRRAIRRADRYQ